MRCYFDNKFCTDHQNKLKNICSERFSNSTFSVLLFHLKKNPMNTLQLEIEQKILKKLHVPCTIVLCNS